MGETSGLTVAPESPAGDAFNPRPVKALADGASWGGALSAASQFATTVISRPSGRRYGPALAEVER